MKAIEMSQNEYHDHRNECNGICLACKEIQYGGVELDARNYPCEACEEKEVFGIEEALLMGAITITD